MSWSGGVSPGSADRAIFDDTAGASLRVDSPRTDIGQLLWTGAPAGGSNFINIVNPSSAVLFIHGIGGVGIDIQSNYKATLYNAIGIVGDQTWRAGNVSGGGFVTSGIGGLVDLGSSTLTADLVNAANTGQLVRFVGTGNVVKTGLGTLTLTGASTFTGSTTVDAGTLALSGSGAIATSSSVLVNNGATFDISATSAGASITTLAGVGDVALGARRLTITAGNDSFSGVLSGTGGLTVAGGTEILTGANTYSGGTTIAAGATLQIGNSGASGSIVGDVANNGTLTMSHSGFAYAFGGVISGTGAVNLSTSSASTTTFTGTNTYTGGTTLSNATLQLGNGGTTGSIVGNVAFNNGSLNFNRSDIYTFGGVISGDGTVFQNGSGTTILTGDNTYTQATEIFNGTLSVASDANLGAPSADYVYIEDATLQTTGTMSSARSIEFGGTSTIATAVGTTLTLTGQVNGYDYGSLTKAGDGTLVLATDVTDLGADTIISAGTLQLGNGGTTGSINLNVTNDGTLAFNRSDTFTFDGVISGTGAVTQIGPGTTVLTGNNSYSGGTEVRAGTLQVASDGNLGDSSSALTIDDGTLHTTGDILTSRTVRLSGEANFEVNGGTTLSLAGDLGGSGSLTKTGEGALVLRGASSYAGDTTVAQGSLSADADNVFNASSAFAVQAAGTLDLAGHGQHLASLANAGTVHFGSTPGTTLAVQGDYSGQGGTLVFNTALAGDASTTDQLVVAGNTAGNTTVRVTNVGGAGAQTAQGIKLIDVQGTSGGTFALQGDYVFQGEQAVVAIPSRCTSRAFRCTRPMQGRCSPPTNWARCSSAPAAAAGPRPRWTTSAAAKACGCVSRATTRRTGRRSPPAGPAMTCPHGRSRPVSTTRWRTRRTAPWSAASRFAPAASRPTSAPCTARVGSRPTPMASTPRSPGMATRASMLTGRPTGAASTASYAPAPSAAFWAMATTAMATRSAWSWGSASSSARPGR